MRKKGLNYILSGTKARRGACLALAFGVFLSGVSFNYDATHAASPTPAGTSGTNSTEDVELDENSKKKKDDSQKETEILKDDNGRISFWEWNRVDGKNVDKYYGDNKYHPSMFVRYSGNFNNPTGFISIYGDKKHIFRKSDTRSDNTEFPAVPEFVYGNNLISHDDKYDQYRTVYLLNDSDGEMLNNQKECFLQKRFFTTGGCMGVLFLKQNDTRVNDRKTYEIALCKPSAKDNPEDMSYLDIGSNRGNEKTYYLYCAATTDNDGERGEPYMFVRTSDHDNDLNAGNRFMLEPFLGEDSYIWNIIAAPTKVDNWSTFYWKGGYFLTGLDMMGNHIKYSTQPRNEEGCQIEYGLYVGEQHVFSTIKGEGGDKTTGAGGVLTIKKDTLYPVRNSVFTDENGNTSKSEGIVLPEKSTIKIEKGGVLSVEGDLLNNGTIYNEGTIIIKDGGCISPYTATDEGKIYCNGGNIIIMPGGKLFSLSDKHMGFDTYSNDIEPNLLLLNNSNVVNYGLFANTYGAMDPSSSIENRKDAVFYAGVNRSNRGVFLNKKVSITDKSLEKTDAIVPAFKAMDSNQSNELDIRLFLEDAQKAAYNNKGVITAPVIGKSKEYLEKMSYYRFGIYDASSYLDNKSKDKSQAIPAIINEKTASIFDYYNLKNFGDVEKYYIAGKEHNINTTAPLY